MIRFACLQCGVKLRVKDEFAGRASRCPNCQQPVHVPDPGRTQAALPKGNIEGSSSSLDRAGVEADVTLAPSQAPAGIRPDAQQAPPAQVQRQKSVADLLAGASSQAGRYVLDEEIARGGMGAVVRGIDRDIRREVAIKFMLDDQDPRHKARFVEEAQITGQLEHPNIVPVHELGVDAQKRFFFTMKMVRGRSLAQTLELLDENPEAEREWSLGRLLTILVNICHALGYAHSRNVIHRDLKPANIMIGDFGEVYVMDWGLAKVLGHEPASGGRKSPDEPSRIRGLTPSARQAQSVSTSRSDESDLTQAGAILGTPAYMPPEQAAGNLKAIDQRSDIYSLGGILYAMLTLQTPIEKDGDYVAMLMRVIEGTIKRPEERTPERSIPPELSAIAMKALAKEPKDRYQTVEAFRRDIELFLEGRSVSAKRDTAWEMAKKFVKRNKGLSVGLGTALVVLLGSMGFLFSAWHETGAAYGAFVSAACP